MHRVTARVGPRAVNVGVFKPDIAMLAGANRPAAAAARIEVYSYDAQAGVDTLAQQSGGTASTDAVVRTAYVNAQLVLDYYQRAFGRNSHDGRGSVLKLRVHAPDATTGQVPANNAYWFRDEGRLWFGDGDGSLFSPLGNAADVVAHEFTHAVIDSEVRLEYVGQQGGLHESFSDVLATGVDGNFTVGEGVYTPDVPGDALRDLAHPTYDNARTLPSWVNEPHELAAIPNYAAYKVAQAVGGDHMRQIWYVGLTGYLQSNAGFAGAMEATVSAARKLYGTDSREYAAVRDAWAAVGVDRNTPLEGTRPAIELFDPRVDLDHNLILPGDKSAAPTLLQR